MVLPKKQGGGRGLKCPARGMGSGLNPRLGEVGWEGAKCPLRRGDVRKRQKSMDRRELKCPVIWGRWGGDQSPDKGDGEEVGWAWR